MYDQDLNYRAFIAIIPPQEARAYLRDINRKLKKFSRNFRFVAIDQLHITLQFLGNSVSGESISQIESQLAGLTAVQEPFTITVHKLNFGFPGQNIASLLYYDLREDRELRSFVTGVHNSLKELGLTDVKKKKDHSKLINHLTVARTKHDMSRSFTREINEFLPTLKIEPISFEVTEIKVLSSEFRDNRSAYSSLVTLPLGKE